MKKLSLLIFIFAMSLNSANGSHVKFASGMKKFLNQYCTDCHKETKAKGDIRLDNLDLVQISNHEEKILHDVLDQLITEEMPSKKAKNKLPESTRAKAISFIQNRLSSTKAGKVISTRRLTKDEYYNTLQDLLGIQLEKLLKYSEFPAEIRHKDTFINDSKTLSLDSYVLDKIIDSNAAVIKQITELGVNKPSAQKRVFKPPFLRDGRDLLTWYYGKNKFQDILQNPFGNRTAYLHISEFKNGVSQRGFYKIKILAEAKNRLKETSKKFGNYPLPLSMLLMAGNQGTGYLGSQQPSDRIIGDFSLPDDKVHTVELEKWLEKGDSLKIGFPQGVEYIKPIVNTDAFSKRKYPSVFKNLDRKKFTNPKEWTWLKSKKGKPYSDLGSKWSSVMEIFAENFPTLRIYSVEIEGPYYKEWPIKPLKVITGSNNASKLNLEDAVVKFAAKAFRRPVRPAELKDILSHSRKVLSQTKNPQQALLSSVELILSLPEFLYLYRNNGQDDYALASRLSYFLWSTMPDERLMALAKSGKLREPEVLVAEVERMLKDPRIDRLAAKLVDEWFELHHLGEMPPAYSKEKQYFQYSVQEYSKRETVEFFKYILQQNRPVTDILNADYSFLNRTMAQQYGIEEYQKFPVDKFIKTVLPDNNRHGIFGHMSVLTATANGVDTSPIHRGLWAYRTVLGRVVPEPPANVPSIEPDLRNAKTIRDQLEKHRNIESCNSCHQRFDYLGFALENFDHLGRWRKDYIEVLDRRKIKKVPVDARGTTSAGQQFNGITELRNIISSNKVQFHKTALKNILSLALGRKMTAGDYHEIDKLTTASSNGGLKEIIKAVILSDLFRN